MEPFIFNSTDELKDREKVLATLKRHGIFPSSANRLTVQLNELFPHSVFFPDIAKESRRTNREVIAAMVDATADSGANSIMLDTRIQSKVARISLTKTSADGLIDLNSLDVKGGIKRDGVLPLEDLKFFVDYCHYRSVESNLAGSFQSYQAQQVWLAISNLDQISTRGGSSAVQVDPRSEGEGSDTRQFRVTQRNLVKGLLPPEQGGALNIPDSVKTQPNSKEIIDQLMDMIREQRITHGLPPLRAYWIDKFGTQTEIK